MDYKKLLIKLDELIRQGEILSAQQNILQLKTSSIPREWLADFADMARRVRIENWGFKILRPLIRSEVPVHPAVTAKELCSYAGLLIKAGAYPEAKEILDNLDEEKVPNVLLFKSQIYFSEWDYKKSLPVLKKAIKYFDLNSYQACITQVNLAGALVSLDKFSEASGILVKLKKVCLDQKWDLLYGNVLEISAQMAVKQKDWALTEQLLSEANSRVGQHSHYSIFIEKWQIIAELIQKSEAESDVDLVLNKIELLRKKAYAVNSWETLRDLDFQQAYYLQHKNLLLNVFFGTPHLQYKKRIINHFKKQRWEMPKTYIRKLTEATTSRVYDMVYGTENGNELAVSLKPGKMVHRLLHILIADFYKPISLGELFSSLFHGEYYNPENSAARVAQAIKQLRKWFKQNAIPVDIKVEKDQYFLVANGPYAFRVSNEIKIIQEKQHLGFKIQLELLKKRWPYQSFSSSSAAKELKVSNSKARQILRKALEGNSVFVSGAGRNILYRFEK